MSQSIPTTADSHALERHVPCGDMVSSVMIFTNNTFSIILQSFKSEAVQEAVTKLTDKSSTKEYEIICLAMCVHI